MKVLICHDDGQLRRVESAIAAIEAAGPCQQQGKLALLQALQIERASLLQYTKRARATSRHAAAPANNRRRLAWLNPPPALVQTLGI